MPTLYEFDVVAWSAEQAALLRAGRLSEIDIEHIADEIEDVGKAEQRELAQRMSILLAHLLQPAPREASWEATVGTQRGFIERRVRKMPSLKACLADPDWWSDAWGDAITMAAKKPGFDVTGLPTECPRDYNQLMANDFFPSK